MGRQGKRNLFTVNEHRICKTCPGVRNLQNSVKIIRFPNTSVSFCCNTPYNNRGGCHCCMVKAIPIKEISPPKVAKSLLRPDIYGRSVLTWQGVQAFPKTTEITVLVSTGSGCTVLQSSPHWPMLEGCCFSCTVPSQTQMSTQAVSSYTS